MGLTLYEIRSMSTPTYHWGTWHSCGWNVSTWIQMEIWPKFCGWKRLKNLPHNRAVINQTWMKFGWIYIHIDRWTWFKCYIIIQCFSLTLEHTLYHMSQKTCVIDNKSNSIPYLTEYVFCHNLQQPYSDDAFTARDITDVYISSEILNFTFIFLIIRNRW